MVPVYLDGIHKTLPKGKNLILPYNCKIIFGDSIQFDSFEVDNIVKKSEYEFNKLIKTDYEKIYTNMSITTYDIGTRLTNESVFDIMTPKSKNIIMKSSVITKRF